MSDRIDTRKGVKRRDLQFDSIDDVLADIDRIAAANLEGRLTSQGNWTPGQVMAHISAWIEYGYDGYPMKKAPWIARVMLRMQLKKIIKNGMTAGARIPGIEQGTVGQDDMPTAEAAARLKSAFERLQSGEEATHDSPGFGAMSHQDRVTLNLRHAELHLSFLDF